MTSTTLTTRSLTEAAEAMRFVFGRVRAEAYAAARHPEEPPRSRVLSEYDPHERGLGRS